MKPRTVQDVGERGVIELIQKYLSTATTQLQVPAGDDCAVYLSPDDLPLQVLTTDLLVEGTHFLSKADTDWHALGRRAIVANLSDLAAMGAQPQCVLCSLGVSGSFALEHLEQLYAGMHEECSRWGTALAGGDTVRAERLLINITATGGKRQSDAPCLRSSCRPGQNVYVSGALGGCRSGLELQLNPQLAHLRPVSWAAQLIARQQVPEPRVSLGRYLSQNHPDVAMIDISDGFYNELQLLSSASGVGFQIELQRVPLYQGVEAFCAALGLEPHQFALGSGEEYELLFCTTVAEPELRAGLNDAGIATTISRIGVVTAGNEIAFLGNRGQHISMEAETFKHFARM